MSVVSAFCYSSPTCRPLSTLTAAVNCPIRRPRNQRCVRFSAARMSNAEDINKSNQSETDIGNPAGSGTPTHESETPEAQQKTAVQTVEDTDGFSTPPVSASAPSALPPPPVSSLPSSPKKQYSLRTRLREEIEAPFRKARMFVYAGSAASAGVGAFIAGLRIIAALTGVSGVQPLNETVPNVAVDIGVVGLMAFLLRKETQAGERRLERMSRGARISKLRVEDVTTRQVVTLKEVRGSKRVIVIAGRADGVNDAMSGALPARADLEESSLRVVPLVTEEYGSVSEEEILRQWRFQPFAKEEWLKWFKEERAVVGKRLKKEGDVIVVVIRLDGKVGARSVGKPLWPRLLEEVKRLPPKDQYGKP